MKPGAAAPVPVVPPSAARSEARVDEIPGDPGTTAVSLKRIDAHHIEETDKRHGKVIAVGDMTVAPDGHTLTSAIHDELAGTTFTIVWNKQ